MTRTRPIVVVALALAAVACDEVDVAVSGLSFEGNEAISDAALANAVVTQASGWLPWSRRYPFDQEVFDADLDRIRAYYDDHGYPDARVADADLAFADDQRSVDITIRIDEGEPVLIERVAFDGLTTFNPTVVAELTRLPLAEGDPRDRLRLAATHEHVRGVLRDSGYPTPTVDARFLDGSAPDRVVLSIAMEPGEAATFGEISLNRRGTSAVDERAVRRTLAFRTGELFRESKLLESQRRLTGLGLFSFAHVAARPLAEGEARPTGTVPIQVTVTEVKPTRTQFGIGYGTEDGPRGSLEWRHLNFLGSARRFTANARYSGRLRGMDLEFTQPYLFSRALSLGVRADAWWRDEPTYTSRTFGGRTTATYQWIENRGLQVEPASYTLRGAYVNESLRYALTQETLDDVTAFEEFIALGFDPTTGAGSGRLASLNVDFTRSMINRPLDPTSGIFAQFHVEHAAPWLGGTFDFDQVEGEGRVYVPVGDAVLAGRARAGVIMAASAQDVPFSARYFLGGSSSLRGWGRFQVAPLTTDGLPIGGQALLELSAEARVPVTSSLGLVAFVDAGNVWATRRDVTVSDLRVDVGPGLRYTTPVGVVRADLGYQLTPIDGLVIGGRPESRRWRVHFSIGHAF